jgi:hypothetical protein
MSNDHFATAQGIRALTLLACPCCRRLHPCLAIEGGLERPLCPDRHERETARPLMLARSPDPLIFAYLTDAEDGSLRFGALRIPRWMLEMINPKAADNPDKRRSTHQDEEP